MRSPRVLLYCRAHSPPEPDLWLVIRKSMAPEPLRLSEYTRIAVLMTCHNRRDTTLGCLDALARQEPINPPTLEVYLVDDGCTDGTAAAVREQFPEARLIQGDGSLFWCGGMRKAWEFALAQDYDAYLWLNDDTRLESCALSKLLTTAHSLKSRMGSDALVAGSTFDPRTGKRTYGGVISDSRWQPMAFRPIEPGSEPIRCDTINGNCVLVPRGIARTVGNISPDFTHGIGDFDYGLRARDAGYSCWITPGYVGSCRGHDIEGSCFDRSLSMEQRLKKFHSHQGPPPVIEWFRFTFRHAGWLWPIYWARTCLRIAFPKLWLAMRTTGSGNGVIEQSTCDFHSRPGPFCSSERKGPV